MSVRVGIKVAAAGVFPVVGAALVMPEFVGKRVIASGTGPVDDTECASGCNGMTPRNATVRAIIDQQNHIICPVLVAQCVDIIHDPIAGVGQAISVIFVRTAFVVGDFSAIDQAHRDIDIAKVVSIIRRIHTCLRFCIRRIDPTHSVSVNFSYHSP